jgi:hypothetical protein
MSAVELAQIMPDVAKHFWGEPNRRHSNKKELRWGTNGARSVNVAKGTWFDHEANEGGGVLDFLKRERVDEPWEWLRQHGYADGGGNSSSNGRRRIVATYDYTDEFGALLFQVCRFDPKDFRQRRRARPDDPPDKVKDGWVWSVKGVRQVPYRLPELIEALAAERRIVVVEGEQDVDRLAKWNVVATCNAGGAGKWRAELSEHFRGADIILIPDNDDAGYAHISMVGAALTGVAARIRVLVLPGLPAKGDVSDWIDSGGTVEQFWALVEAAAEWIPPAAGPADNSAAKQVANDAEQRLIDELARLPPLEYDKRRTEVAGELGIRRGTLDNAREARRAEMAAEAGPPPLFGHWVVEPWSEEVDGDALLLAIMRRIQRHVILSNHEASTITLWILMTWVHQEAAIHSPILLVTSAEANSGKTTLVNLIGFMVPRGLISVGISEAALYRAIELYEPVILVDEADTALIDNEALRGVVNSGWTRGQGVLRCIGDSNTPHLFPTFCPKVLGMKGRKLPDTTMSRCIVIELRRKKPAERAEHFDHTDDADLSNLRRHAMRWSMDNIGALKAVSPPMPPGFENRLGDNWRLLLAVADLAGGEWPELARQAAATVAKVAGDASIGVRLLTDIRRIFEERGVDRIASAELVSVLGEMEDGPWPEWKGGKPITQAGVARVLKPFGIVPDTIRISPDKTAKGYYLAGFQDAFERYL